MEATWVDPQPLRRVVDRLRSGSLDLDVYVDELCDRLERAETDVHAYVEEPARRERLHAEAAELEQRWPDVDDRPPLFGVPVAVKDIVRVDGLPTRAGSQLPPEALAGPQAVMVDRLRDAGALVAGKSVTAEFAHFAPGQTRNPHELTRTPGGSSSGSAAAVSAGTALLATGTQTVGSLVRPAAFCGVVGWKSTHGRVPKDGVIDHSPSLDALGMFAADVDGVTAAARALCHDWSEPPAVDRLVLGLPVGSTSTRSRWRR
ncbi:MAG: amidase [Nocardioidaceae bacterium]